MVTSHCTLKPSSPTCSLSQLPEDTRKTDTVRENMHRSHPDTPNAPVGALSSHKGSCPMIQRGGLAPRAHLSKADDGSPSQHQRSTLTANILTGATAPLPSRKAFPITCASSHLPGLSESTRCSVASGNPSLHRCEPGCITTQPFSFHNLSMGTG